MELDDPLMECFHDSNYIQLDDSNDSNDIQLDDSNDISIASISMQSEDVPMTDFDTWERNVLEAMKVIECFCIQIVNRCTNKSKVMDKDEFFSIMGQNGRDYGIIFHDELIIYRLSERETCIAQISSLYKIGS